MKLYAYSNSNTNDTRRYPYKCIFLSHTILQFLQMNSFNEIIEYLKGTIVQSEKKSLFFYFLDPYDQFIYLFTRSIR